MDVLFNVINERTDKVVTGGEWANLDDADTHAAELNADYPNGSGPYMVVPETLDVVHSSEMDVEVTEPHWCSSCGQGHCGVCEVL